jgi:hypothetical protein
MAQPFWHLQSAGVSHRIQFQSDGTFSIGPMRSAEHKKALDNIRGVLTAANSCISNTKATLTRYIEWLDKSRKIMKHIHATLDNVHIDDPNLHPQILGAQRGTLTALSARCGKIQNFMELVFIKKSKEASQNYAKSLEPVIPELKHFMHLLANYHEGICSHVKRPVECTGTYLALEAAFSNHCTYLKYFIKIDEFEESMTDKMGQLLTLLNEINTHLDNSVAQVNKLFVGQFGRSLTEPSATAPPVKLTKTEDDTFAAHNCVIVSAHAVFRQPAFQETCLYTFASDPPMKMVAKSAYPAGSEEELSLDADEVVDLVNAEGLQFWKVRKGNGSEGYVSARGLKPYIPPKAKA